MKHRTAVIAGVVAVALGALVLAVRHQPLR